MTGSPAPGVAQPIFSNGVDGTTGRYLLEGVTVSMLAAAARNAPIPKPPEAAAISYAAEPLAEMAEPAAEGAPENDLAKMGWGVILANDLATGVREALSPLLDLRRAQASKANPAYYHEFSGDSGVHAGDDALAFLEHHGAAGPTGRDPQNVPYYLLVVGSPSSIPFDFQTALDVDYAVGRVDFDTVEQYAQYAETVVRSEKGLIPRARSASFFAPSRDRATAASNTRLVTPVAEHFKGQYDNWTVETFSAEAATKAQLVQVFHKAPALLFTASHGMGFPAGHPLQEQAQGALLCQDWMPYGAPSVPAASYFGADDVADDADIQGTIAFNFACFSGGTPQIDDFLDYVPGQNHVLAQEPFVARLPHRMLSHPRGCALAVVGHVNRAWGWSFLWPGADEDVGTFDALLSSLADGGRLGHAMTSFGQRYAVVCAYLTQQIHREAHSGSTDDPEVAQLWTASTDAANFAVFGDPAVRLSLADG